MTDTTIVDAAALQQARVALDVEECTQAVENDDVRRLLDMTLGELIQFCLTQFPSLSLAERRNMATLFHVLAIAARPALRPAPMIASATPTV